MRLGENDKDVVLARTTTTMKHRPRGSRLSEGDQPTAEQLADMEAADEASASEEATPATRNKPISTQNDPGERRFLRALPQVFCRKSRLYWTNRVGDSLG